MQKPTPIPRNPSSDEIHGGYTEESFGPNVASPKGIHEQKDFGLNDKLARINSINTLISELNSSDNFISRVNSIRPGKLDGVQGDEGAGRQEPES